MICAFSCSLVREAARIDLYFPPMRDNSAAPQRASGEISSARVGKASALVRGSPIVWGDMVRTRDQSRLRRVIDCIYRISGFIQEYLESCGYWNDENRDS